MGIKSSLLYKELAEFIANWEMTLPNYLNFQPTVGKKPDLVKVKLDDFLTREKTFDKQILLLVEKTIKQKDLRIKFVVITFDGKGEDAFYPVQKLFQMISPYVKMGLMEPILSYQGDYKKFQPKIVKWCHDNNIRVMYANDISLVDDKNKEKVSFSQMGKAEHLMKIYSDLTADLKVEEMSINFEAALHRTFVITWDDDYVMTSLENILAMACAWTLGYAKSNVPKIKKLIKKFQGLESIANSSTRFNFKQIAFDVRPAIIEGTREVLTYPSLFKFCLKRYVELIRKGVLVKNGSVRRYQQLEIKINQLIVKGVVLTPYNLKDILTKKEYLLLKRVLDYFVDLGGRVTLGFTRRMAKRPYEIPQLLSEYDYILNGDYGTSLWLVRQKNLAPGYAFEIVCRVQDILATTRESGKKRTVKSGFLEAQPHIHIPQHSVEYMEFVIDYYYDIMLFLQKLEPLSYLVKKYLSKSMGTKIIRRNILGKVKRIQWNPHGQLYRQPLFFEPLQGLKAVRKE